MEKDMSYDIRLKVKVADLDNKYVNIARPEYDSPTYNLGKMFRTCMDWDFDQSSVYPCSEVIQYVAKGLQELRDPAKKAKYKKLEPSNGWGDIHSAIAALESLRTCIYETAESNEIPLENLYMEW